MFMCACTCVDVCQNIDALYSKLGLMSPLLFLISRPFGIDKEGSFSFPHSLLSQVQFGRKVMIFLVCFPSNNNDKYRKVSCCFM